MVPKCKSDNAPFLVWILQSHPSRSRQSLSSTNYPVLTSQPCSWRNWFIHFSTAAQHLSFPSHPACSHLPTLFSFPLHLWCPFPELSFKIYLVQSSPSSRNHWVPMLLVQWGLDSIPQRPHDTNSSILTAALQFPACMLVISLCAWSCEIDCWTKLSGWDCPWASSLSPLLVLGLGGWHTAQ